MVWAVGLAVLGLAPVEEQPEELDVAPAVP